MHYPGVSLEGMLQGYRDQYLQKVGWIRSVEQRTAVDAQGEPVPWLTYPANAFLSRALNPDWKVFEFGGGSSTAWWSRRVAEIISVDHDPVWQRRTEPLCSGNVRLRLTPEDLPSEAESHPLIKRYFAEVKEPENGLDPEARKRAGLLSGPYLAYAGEILLFPERYFDVVVIDGMARSLTTWLAIQHAKPRKFILFDNSDRNFYDFIFAMLRNAGYHRIDFWGTGPINPYEWCTSIFVHELSALPL